MSEKEKIKKYPLSLSATLVLVFLTAASLSLGAFYSIFQIHNKKIFHIMSEKLLASKGETIQNTINNALDLPRQANAIVIHSLGIKKDFNINDVRSELLYILETVFPKKEYLSSVTYGSVDGHYVGIIRDSKHKNQEYLTQKLPSTHNKLTFYHGVTEASGISYVIEDYSVLERPWYTNAAKDNVQGWVPIYLTENHRDNELAISYSSSVYNRRGDLAGVISSDLSVTALNNLLKKVKPFNDSVLLVVNADKQIIAASDRLVKDGAQRPTQNKAHSIYNLADIKSAKMREINSHFNKNGVTSLDNFTIDEARYYMLSFPIQSSVHDLKWNGIVVVSEKVLLKEIKYYKALFIFGFLVLFLVGTFGILLVISKTTTPLKEISKKAISMGSSRWVINTENRLFPEVLALELSFWKLSRNLNAAFDSLRRKIERDTVTGLYTREGLLKDSTLYEKRTILSIVQLSNYSIIVNTLGVDYGNKYIKNFVDKATRVLPVGTLLCCDAPGSFIFVPPPIYSQQEIDIYENCLHSLFHEEPGDLSINSGNMAFTGFIGIVSRELNSKNILSSIQQAGVALNSAKSRGNSGIAFYTNSMLEQELKNIQLHESLNKALTDEEVRLVLQPIVNLHNPQLSYEGECLIRWHSELLGNVSPAEFIPLAEETGLIIKIGKWVIQRSCLELKKLIDNGLSPDFKLHVNISAIQLAQPGFARHLLDSIQINNLKNTNLCIEITESQLLQESESVLDTLQYLRNHGVTVAIDDFGSGFSSLSYLHKLPFDCIKIDRGFIKDILHDEKNKAVVTSVIFLATSFNVPVVAEGVEDSETEELLLALKCEKAQGYYYSKPVPFDDLKIEESGGVTIN